MSEKKFVPNEMSLPDQIRLLEANAERLAEINQQTDAEKLYRHILELAPTNEKALGYLIQSMANNGDLDGAQKMAEQAIRNAPEKAAWHRHLGVILRTKGFYQGAIKAFNESLKRNSLQPLTWIQRGDVQYFLGDVDDAICSFYTAEFVAGDLTEAAKVRNGRASEFFSDAGKKLNEKKRAMVDDSLNALKNDAPADAFQRVETAIKNILKLEEPNYADSLQKPEFCYFPGLSAKPFHDLSAFPYLRELQNAKDVINKELEAFLAAHSGHLAPYVNIPPGQEKQWSNLNNSDQWSALHLFRGGSPVDENCSKFPETLKILAQLPLVDIPSQAPEVFFSVLKPGTHIPPHHGIANYKLAVHLPLVIPGKCAIRVGDETRMWEEGKCLIFDDSFEHEAWNRSETIRVVLIMEIWHPDLTEVEKKSIRVALGAIQDFNDKYSTLIRGV